LYRAIRAAAKPLRMRAHVRMIGRALQREVQCDLDAASARRFEQPPELSVSTELRMHGLVTPFVRTDRPWAADICSGRGDCVVPAFAPLTANRMDGRKI